jgi:hypothetical protein
VYLSNKFIGSKTIYRFFRQELEISPEIRKIELRKYYAIKINPLFAMTYRQKTINWGKYFPLFDQINPNKTIRGIHLRSCLFAFLRLRLRYSFLSIFCAFSSCLSAFPSLRFSPNLMPVSCNFSFAAACVGTIS